MRRCNTESVDLDTGYQKLCSLDCGCCNNKLGIGAWKLDVVGEAQTSALDWASTLRSPETNGLSDRANFLLIYMQTEKIDHTRILR